jgi:MFS transporter, DHA2 family, multidrug resistance protein
VIAAAMYNLTNLYGGLNFGWFALQRVFIGIGLPLIFIPITSASYDGIPKDKTDLASALINMARNTGGSIGVSIGQNALAYREQFHQSRLVEHISPTSPAYQEALRNMTAYFQSRGASAADAANQAIAAIGQTVQQQAGLWAYIDVFFILAIMALAIVPLALLLRSTKPGAAAAAA